MAASCGCGPAQDTVEKLPLVLDEPVRERLRRIPADRWCVTRQDLRYLRRTIRRAIQDGEIQPTDSDQFDVADDVIGPNIYTVNQQWILPTTAPGATGGGLSWALMRNPDGVKCDLFVTHAWTEGIFEFVDKVLASWPADASHAYCCMLSNPQHFIEDFITGAAGESPFAHALHAARYVLVVPNATASIYSRLWCVYEAYLAYKEEKIILTASSPIWLDLVRAMPPLILSAVASAIAARIFHSVGVALHIAQLVMFIFMVIMLKFTLVLKMPWRRRLCHCLGASAAASLVGLRCRMVDMNPVFLTWLGLFFCMCEVDNVRAVRAHLDRQGLNKGYTGHVGDASCSRSADAQSIWEDIGDNSAAVDEAIAVLTSAGMSTRALRTADCRGVDLFNAGHYELASPFLIVGFTSFWLPCLLTKGRWCQLGYWLNIALLVGWFALLVRAPRDEKAFVCKAVNKVLMHCHLIFGICAGLLFAGILTIDVVERVILVDTLIAWALIFSCLLAGIEGVLRLPFGTALVRFAFGRGLRD